MTTKMKYLIHLSVLLIAFSFSQVSFSKGEEESITPSQATEYERGGSLSNLSRQAAGNAPTRDSNSSILSSSLPEFHEKQTERNRMVSTQIERGSMPVMDKNVLKAMRRVPRHAFVPSNMQPLAYANRPLPIGHGQTISQPFIVAYMTEKLELTHGDKVLEIGTGSGYQAAVLAEITPNVYTVEIIKELGNEAKIKLRKLGYNTIRTKIADGYFGWEEHAPYDAIIVTCAAGHAPPELIKQLKPGGRMIIPIGGVYEVQMLMVVMKDKKGGLKTRQILPVRFVPMTGEISGANKGK